MDAESIKALQERAAADTGLAPRLAHRLVGSSLHELRADAQAALRDFGYGPPPARDARGRFTDQIRAAAGRAPTQEPEAPEGQIGIGLGAGARERPRPQPDMNSLIRGAHAGRRTVSYELAEQLATEEAT